MSNERRKLRMAWSNMKARCNNRNTPFYKRYGGRGIAVCKEWAESSEVFIEWAMSNGWADGLQLDRIDNNGNYEPENCRWVTAAENMNNRRNTISVTAFGETKTALQWLSDPRCNATSVTCITTRLNRGDSPERAIGSPPRKGALQVKECVICGATFTAERKRSQCCSLPCGLKLAFFKRRGYWPPEKAFTDGRVV